MKDSKTKTNFFKNLLENKYTLITNIDDITTIAQKVKVMHDGIEYETVFKNFADGYMPHKNNSNKIKNIEIFKQRVFDIVGNEYEVLPNQIYINNKTPIQMIHKNCGRVIKTLTADTFFSGKRCKYCSGKYTPDLLEIKENLKKVDDFEILNLNDYVNLTTKNIKVKHLDCGKEYLTTMNKILKHVRCPFCSNSVLKDQRTFDEEIKESGNNEFEVLDKYVDCKTKLRIKHKTCGNVELVRPFDFLYNRKCKCLNCRPTGKSLEEEEVKEFIKSLGFKPKKLKKKIDGKWYELDIFIEKLNIGIEFNGIYWHAEGVSKDKLNLFNKMKAYDSIGIRIINIFEDEWVFKKELTKNKLKNILKKSELKTIYARNCKIDDISTKEKNIFLNKYHIQGDDRSNIKKGLFYNDELVAVMTFSKLRASLGNKKNSNEGKYELSRFATKYHIPGGFSKLFRHTINEYNLKNIVTYADLRWSNKNGNLYIKNGFKLTHISKPNYWYTDGRKRFHRYSFRKQALSKKFPEIYNDKLTEFQIMNKTNYKRIWDCGNLVYEWTC